MPMNTPIRVGLMGFGLTGRQVYRLATASDDIEVVAIADIGDSRILHYLLCSEAGTEASYILDGNFLCHGDSRARMMPIDLPSEMPWDVLGVDVVIDATGKYRSRSTCGHA